jgi:hypothetical protein
MGEIEDKVIGKPLTFILLFTAITFPYNFPFFPFFLSKALASFKTSGFK